MTALWDTTGNEVVRELAAARRSDGMTSGLALTLVAVVDERPGTRSTPVKVVEDAATVAASMHPCRILVVTRTPVGASSTPDRLDAEIVVGGRLGPCEAVIMRMQGRLALHAESVVMPLLAPDVPVVTWWHGAPPAQISTDPLGVVAERRITDCSQADDPQLALRQRAIDYAAGDTDLAWTRLTGWRTLVAGALDAPAGSGVDPVAATIRAPGDDVSAQLLAGWLGDRLGLAVTLIPTDAPTLAAVELRFPGGNEISLSRHDGSAVLRRSGQEDRRLPLLQRTLGEELAEELRRLDADQPYAAALAAATGVAGLWERPAGRVFTWVDPADAAEAEAAAAAAAAIGAAAQTGAPAATEDTRVDPAGDVIPTGDEEESA
ncbi:glucose-6-phosphate dehydrogenase assembly protein OpcA [Natronosporangium hydrolyticum]|uniref:Glucose-6-phosphate dehydrogenase assembly protein OpcA n=1 Tax=Natronosporangium hydrolyticum TaxID=2811111 RepID=A0A895YGW4_9ACTN|nr:glucose-6-phosphate dehydrogenase assembly protein OpcA [Natronosporangium hydrolyticum]